MTGFARVAAGLLAAPIVCLAARADAFPVPMDDPLVVAIHARADAGDVEAMLDMAGFSDGPKAQAWLERAAQAKDGKTGDAEAMLTLSEALKSGGNGVTDLERSKILIRQAAEKGNGTAAFVLDYPVFDGPPSADPLPYPAPSGDNVDALRWARAMSYRLTGHDRTANEQRITALLKAGYGAHLTSDRRLFEAMLIQARQPDSSASFDSVGRYYLEGSGVAPDAAQAEYWFRRAADIDAPQIQVEVAEHYENGDFGPGREAMARIYYQRYADKLRPYADQGSEIAQSQLGNLYDTGKLDVPDADVRAVYWYRKAAKQGEPGAEIGLGRMLIAGRGTAKNVAAGVRWLTLAAGKGHISGDVGYDRMSEAQQVLGEFYLAGHDYAHAAFWLELAYETRMSGDSEEAMARGTLLTDEDAACRAHMTPEQIARSKAQVDAWLKAHKAPEE